MSKSLVIVESPAKARTIAGYLGDGYVVESSIGHIRDLPSKKSQIPAAQKERFGRKNEVGVDVEDGFKPLYLVDPDKKQQISKLKKLLANADVLYLATDEDREGESIAWHLLEVLQPKVPVKRMVFHEITKKAIHAAIAAPREIDRRLVDAQEARRILDRLYGYTLSDVLWRRVGGGLSAGRVQSVATRMVVERERKRMAFRRVGYWDLVATFGKKDGGGSLEAKLTIVDGQRLATGKDFSLEGELHKDGLVVLEEAAATALAQDLSSGAAFTVGSVERKPYRRKPAAPFMTSTLQQEASRKLRYGARKAMVAAQRLYEGGYITYMRTDSTTLSEAAISAARRQIEQLYGESFVPAEPRVYVKKVKNAQEAHEAIRPAGDTWKKPEQVARELPGEQARLYELIWKRTVASQMEDARGETLSVKVCGKSAAHEVTFSVSGRTISFPGFLRAYVEGSDDPEAELENQEKHLPPLALGEALDAKSIEPDGHETQPPSRFTEASLVRALEELGVGRPSTYASILSTIESRGYVWKKSGALVPSFVAFSVVALLEKHFPLLIDYAFTAKMEDELDSIASGDERVGPWLQRFYLGSGSEGSASHNGMIMDVGLKHMVASRLEEIDAREINSLRLGEDEQGRTIVVRVGRWGPYLERGEERARLPDQIPPDELTIEMAVELLEKPSDDRELGTDPDSGEKVIARAGRFGPYVQLGEASAKRKSKPKTASLFKSMSLETLTLEEALKLLTLPREIGIDDDGEVIKALNGRYGPYVQKAKETRSLESEAQIFTVTIAEAKALLAAPKRGRRAAASAEPLRTLGDDPVSGKQISVKEGRWGPYVTDGETNQSLLTEDTIENMTTERAAELLQRRRDRGPAKKRTNKKASKKTTSKKTTSKKTTSKKTTSKKKTAKKKTAKKKTSKKKTSKKKTAG